MVSDALVIGAGLGGALAAAVLSRAGLKVVVVDRHAAYPPDFRAEQLVGSQADTLRHLGLLEGIVGQTTPMPSATAACHGKVIDATYCDHYGLRYEEMVNAARALSAPTTFITGRVAQIVTGAEAQKVHLADGRVLDTRLVVFAAGPNSGDLLSSLGIERTMLSEHHSLTFGFDVETASRGVFVYYGERTADQMDYLTVFPIGNRMRANLFCYLHPNDPWARSFKHSPKQALLSVMPSLERALGPFEVVGKVQVRPNSIQRAENVRGQAGIVVIGDAYQSSCPAVGTGIGRLLADIEALNRHVSLWLATPGMDADKIEQFYDDPAKRKVDAHALRIAKSRRALCTGTGWGWQAYRAQHYYRRRTLGVILRAIRRERPRLDGTIAGPQHLQLRADAPIRARASGWEAAKRAVMAAITLLTIG